nr:hypothetical protein GCM10020092_062080 [Actinoplanes digitatis]
MVTAHIRNLDYWSWAPEMDVVANDHYLDHRLGDPTAELSFAADLTRGLADGAPWMLMEQSAGAVNWQPHNLAKLPGQMLRNSLTHVARGADSLCFFQWRASARGAEKFHSALVPHAGTDTRAWREVLDLSATLAALAEVADTTVQADVALLFSWESWWSADTEARPSQDVRYLEQVHAAYGAVRELGVTADVVAPGADLSRYRMVVVPCLHLVTDEEAAGIDAYVAGGGHAVVTFYSGIVDGTDRVRLGGYPGAFRDLLGVVAEEFHPLLPGDRVRLCGGGTATLWTELLRTTTAKTIDAYADGPLPGVPADHPQHLRRRHRLVRRHRAGPAGPAGAHGRRAARGSACGRSARATTARSRWCAAPATAAPTSSSSTTAHTTSSTRSPAGSWSPARP